MATTSAKSFLRMLERSGIVADERLTHALNALKQEVKGSVVGLEKLTEHLIDSGLITKWHCEKITDGKYKGFFLGKFKLLGHLGTGGMSTVYLAEHRISKQYRAIKVLPRKKVDDKSFLDRFYREARAAAVLNHPNIVRVYDINGEDKTHYMVMEFVEGLDLHEMVKNDGPLPFEKAVDYIRQAAIGLKHAHERNLVHRDIKPANLLVNDKGTLKILDLGLALLEVEDEESLTVLYNEKVMGTADYLSPEQAVNSHQVDHRADIYSLGCTFYYLLTGHPPFPKGTLAQRIAMHQSRDPEDIRTSRKDCPEAIVDYCSLMMRKDVDKRVENCDKIISAFEKFQECGSFIDESERTQNEIKINLRKQGTASTSSSAGPMSIPSTSQSGNKNVGSAIAKTGRSLQKQKQQKRSSKKGPNPSNDKKTRIALLVSFATAAALAVTAATMFASSWFDKSLEVASVDETSPELSSTDQGPLPNAARDPNMSDRPLQDRIIKSSNRPRQAPSPPTANVAGPPKRKTPIALSPQPSSTFGNGAHSNNANLGFEMYRTVSRDKWNVSSAVNGQPNNVGSIRSYGNGKIITGFGRESKTSLLVYGKRLDLKQGARGVEFRPIDKTQQIEQFSFWVKRQRADGKSSFTVQAKSLTDNERWKTVYTDPGTISDKNFSQIVIDPASLIRIDVRKIRFRLDGEKEDGIYLDDLEITYLK